MHLLIIQCSFSALTTGLLWIFGVVFWFDEIYNGKFCQINDIGNSILALSYFVHIVQKKLWLREFMWSTYLNRAICTRNFKLKFSREYSTFLLWAWSSKSKAKFYGIYSKNKIREIGLFYDFISRVFFMEFLKFSGSL